MSNFNLHHPLCSITTVTTTDSKVLALHALLSTVVQVLATFC